MKMSEFESKYKTKSKSETKTLDINSLVCMLPLTVWAAIVGVTVISVMMPR